jgi:hypothetical protein
MLLTAAATRRRKLNGDYRGCVLRRGAPVEGVLARLATNDATSLAIDAEAPNELRQLGALGEEFCNHRPTAC